jgi:hypothetical protein
VDGTAEPPFIKTLLEKNLLFRIGKRSFSPLSFFEEPIAASDTLAPALFIYHATRCGSTLLGRLLGSHPENRIFNEPSAVSQLLMGDTFADHGRRISYLRTMVSAFGIGAPSGQKNLVFKFASLCNLFVADINEAFPGTPSVFIYRDPIEIMVGLVTEPALWLYDIHYEKVGNVLPWSKEEAATLSLEQLACRYLELQFRWALDNADNFARLINYTEMPEVAFEIAESLLGTNIRERAAELLLWNVKKPTQQFVPDSHIKQERASGLIRELVATHLYPVYHALEAKRQERLFSIRLPIQQ